MKRTVSLATALLAGAAFLSLITNSPAAAQSSLDELERRLEDLPEAAARPREPGYLGLVADDTLLAGTVRVTAVYADGPAAAAGIEPGDVIHVIGGAEIRTLDDLGRVLAAYEAGKTIDMELRRAGRRVAARVTLGRRPAAGASSPVEARPALGVIVDPVTPETRARYGLTVATGALVRSVQAGSPAAEAGLLPGAAIVALDGRRIDRPDELAAVVATMRVGQEAELTYYIGDALYRKRVRLSVAGGGPAAPDPLPVDPLPVDPLPREAAKPAAPAPGLAEDVAELKRQAALLQSQLAELQRRISALETRLPK
jgi:S1-C subfamily serine protease